MHTNQNLNKSTKVKIGILLIVLFAGICGAAYIAMLAENQVAVYEFEGIAILLMIGLVAWGILKVIGKL